MNLAITTERALVLRIEPSGESFYKLDVLTRETGHILCLKRISKKSLSHVKADLFDTADILLDSPRQGTVRFIKDYHLVQRRSSMGKSYRRLQYASEFCSFIVRNAPNMPEPANLYEMTERTFNAFAEKESPEIVSLKALYLILKAEGYPVRESWWPQLPACLRESARQLINNPTPDGRTSEEQIKICLEIDRNLRNWLSRETDIVLP